MDYIYSRPRNELDGNPLLSDGPFNKHDLNPQLPPIGERRHESPFDEGRIDVGLDNLKVRLVKGITEEKFKQVVGRAVMATTGIDPDNLPDNLPWEEMMKGGLQTALETEVIVFDVAGVSRTCTHQLVRTRRATFHQQSQRATFMGYWPNLRMPESVWRNEQARMAWGIAAYQSVRAYNDACNAGVSYQDARWILPEATETYIMCEYPLRTFLEVYAYRGCPMFQWEYVHVMREMRKLLVAAHPWLEPYIKISCEKSQRCTFQGWEQIEGHCTLPWAKEELRLYRPDPKLRIG
jgi:thymidylate synthase (FAD)